MVSISRKEQKIGAILLFISIALTIILILLNGVALMYGNNTNSQNTHKPIILTAKLSNINIINTLNTTSIVLLAVLILVLGGLFYILIPFLGMDKNILQEDYSDI